AFRFVLRRGTACRCVAAALCPGAGDSLPATPPDPHARAHQDLGPDDGGCSPDVRVTAGGCHGAAAPTQPARSFPGAVLAAGGVAALEPLLPDPLPAGGADRHA